MFGLYSARTNCKLPEKYLYSARFFKKLSASDENEKNAINFMEKMTTPKNTSNLSNLSTSEIMLPATDLSNTKSKKKSGCNNLTSIPGKTLTTIESVGLLPSSHKNSCLRAGKGENHKHLKIGSEVIFPKMSNKSGNQATSSLKSEESGLKQLEIIDEDYRKTKIRKKSNCHLTINLKINQFRLGRKLGSGRFGCVYLAEEK
jgi:hypothetical protein